MADHWTTAVNETEGPAAPRDPVVKRRGLYILYETIIEATIRPDGKYTQEMYLDGSQLVDKARFNGGVTDEAMLELLRSSSGLRRLVDRIGISVRAHEPGISTVQFTYWNWGKTNPYETGSRLSITCPTDGTEALLVLDDDEGRYQDDNVPGKFVFEFEQEGALATATIVFYLRDGFLAPDVTADPPVDVESQAYRDMIKKSLVSPGNNIRLKKAIEKAKRGEYVSIAYIGGSITQGAGAVPLDSQCYAYQSYDLFKRMFAPAADSPIRLIKAGVGGTPSELGIVRYDRDVLREGAVEPDIVIVEFAVNDAGDETKGNCYESLVLKALRADHKPAVILLFSVFVNDWNLQDRLAPVGWHYNLPMVSVKDAVTEQFRWTREQGNVITKRQFFYDIYHPTNAGHRVMADCLGWLFEVTDHSNVDEEDFADVLPPLIGNDFVGIKLLDRLNGDRFARIDAGGFSDIDTDLQMAEMGDHAYGTPQFPHNWMHTADSGKHSFRMTIRSKSLILVYKDSGRREFGTAKIWVDGKLKKTADPHEVNWTHCNAVILYNDPNAEEHAVEIEMAEGHEDKRFTILGFGYVP
ncbi:GDSL-like Lipase/Acylhydrolase family protein [Paenibacillus sp. cl141a]|uniref:SGNH/GDSL hydrolase family protein n=1 Tax=Paenibacillus sp. cl141a TaxID=1761877 RepID=UPI0008B27C5D|nr:SGNH/GDSL hydrolase family protein [Paenibacillus sp. cl141a]SEM57078.1 GDSL-like Lipase/Acylhydrolase family protein [Paenibacillus sp. cl141a]